MQAIHRHHHSMDERPRPGLSQTSSSDSNVIHIYNENWRGKNDPAERRRIQNRLNQRAFRERQRAGQSPKQYKPRGSSRGSPAQDDDDEFDAMQNGDSPSTPTELSSATPNVNRSRATCSNSSERTWDELGQLINRNFMAAASTNAQRLGIASTTLQNSTPILTPRSTSSAVPASLQPIQPQYQVPHDPIIDIIPHPRLRYNILRAIASRQLDMAAFSRDLRASGAIENLHGQNCRGGLVVWSSPEQLASWELSEAFFRKWGWLIQGCEDLLAATNAWRGRRGERLFPQSLNLS